MTMLTTLNGAIPSNVVSTSGGRHLLALMGAGALIPAFIMGVLCG